MADNKYPQGLKGFQKRQGSPDFVVCSIIIEPRALFDWLKTDEGRAALKDYNGTKQLKLSVNKSKTGNFLNFAVDNYEGKTDAPKAEAKKQSSYDDSQDLPF